MDDHDDHGEHGSEPERVTSPMQPFNTGQVAIGAAVAAVGLLLAFGLPLVLV